MQHIDPFKILAPEERWAPSQSQMDAFQNAYEKLLPPLVYKIRKAVAKWRDDGYVGASDTSKALLRFWFEREHVVRGQKFRFYFSQREAMESIVYLYEVAKARDKYDLLRYDSSERVSAGMFDESWTRYVVKMATGAGKTKVIGLTMVWSYFHKLYESDSTLSKNFLLIAPNIIVLNRLRKDYDGLKMIFEEPFIPENGYMDTDWQSDFQVTVHIQDELKAITGNGNLFLSNVHRVFFDNEPKISIEETFLGAKPNPNADTSKGLDLGKVLRSSKIKDLVVLNDEAHHVHDKSLAWFKNIENISHTLKLKNGNGLSLQMDYSATPKHNNGGIFVQTISDYPLVEAIKQNVVKSPVMPDAESRAKLTEKDSSDFVERYFDFMHLGYTEWERQYEEHKERKTPILFIMTMSTKEADQAAAFLESTYPLMKNAVLTIHTNNSGEIKEGTGKKDQEELKKLREAVDSIDSDSSPYRAVVSVLMLREGWDVRNVTTVVGLRPFGADSKILPEQTIGRGLRKMYGLNTPEKLTVIGTEAFLTFVEELSAEGVEFGHSPMGIGGGKQKKAIIIEIDQNNPNKDLDALDIAIPQLSPRLVRDYKNLEKLDVDAMKNEKFLLRPYRKEELVEIVFKDIEDEFSHKTIFTAAAPDYRNILSFLTSAILKENRLVSGFHILYPKVEQFIRQKLFDKIVELDDPKVMKNLSEAKAKHILYTSFKKAIDELTVTDKGKAEVKSYYKLTQTRPKVVDEQNFIVPKKSVFNKIIGDNDFELRVAAALENRFKDVVAFAKNTLGENGVNFKVEYQAEDGNIREYYPDFLAKTSASHIYVIETKGREDLDDLRKIKRLCNWCEDVNKVQAEYQFKAIYIRQEDWEKKEKDIKAFGDVVDIFGL